MDAIIYKPFCELTEVQKAMVQSDSELERITAAELGLGLDVLVRDPSQAVRRAVAWAGYGLDELVDDPFYTVRCAVADSGYGLDKLAVDPEALVRRVVRDCLDDDFGGIGLEDWIASNPDRCALVENKIALSDLDSLRAIAFDISERVMDGAEDWGEDLAAINRIIDIVQDAKMHWTPNLLRHRHSPCLE